jgi:hypothetical protein
MIGLGRYVCDPFNRREGVDRLFLRTEGSCGGGRHSVENPAGGDEGPLIRGEPVTVDATVILK